MWIQIPEASAGRWLSGEESSLWEAHTQKRRCDRDYRDCDLTGDRDSWMSLEDMWSHVYYVQVNNEAHGLIFNCDHQPADLVLNKSGLRIFVSDVTSLYIATVCSLESAYGKNYDIWGVRWFGHGGPWWGSPPTSLLIGKQFQYCLRTNQWNSVSSFHSSLDVNMTAHTLWK